MRTKRLFHFALADAWEAAQGQTLWSPSSLETEGFVHLSFAEQLQGTLDTHYGQVQRVILLELSPTLLGDDLKLELSRGDALFPHLYRGIRLEEFIGNWEIERHSSEGWVLPTL